MHYLIISDEYRPCSGGIARFAGEVADGLIEAGNQVTVYTNVRRQDDSAGRLERAKIELYEIRGPRSLHKLYRLFLWPFTLAWWLRRKPFERVLIIDPVNALPMRLMRLLTRREFDVILHGSEILHYADAKLTNSLFRNAIESASCVFTTTAFVQTSLAENFDIQSARVSCGVSRKFLSPPTEVRELARIRAHYGIAESDFLVGTISRLDFRKGHDLVIEALAPMARSHRHLKYFVGGVGPEYDRLRQLAQSVGVADRVIFAGKVDEDELVKHYEMLDVFVMPNRVTDHAVEGFGISFVEAASRGVPSIGVDNGGVSEAIANGVSGSLLASATVETVAGAIQEILDGNVLFDRARIIEHGHQFQWENVVKRIIQKRSLAA